MRLVVDSSSLISLAWAGQLSLLPHAPIGLVIPDEVRHETVVEGLDRGHPDAAAIESVIKDMHTCAAAGVSSADQAVLIAATTHGALLTNDLALGRRAANLEVRWLRTADLVLLCVRAGRLDGQPGAAALRALADAGRLTEALLRAYLEEL